MPYRKPILIQETARFSFDQVIPSRGLRWLFIALGWTIIGLVNFGSALLAVRRLQPNYPAWAPLTWELSSVCLVGLLAPLVVRFTRKLEFRRPTWHWSLLGHFALAIPFSLIHTSGMVGLRKTVYWLNGRSYDFGGGHLAKEYLYEFSHDIQTYWILVLVTLGFDYYNRYREREQRLTLAQLHNLREQLNPHFLFNTLNMISAKMYEDVAQADAMITRLSDLLRLTLRTSDQFEVPLQTDLEALNLYLEIMKARFADAVRIEMNIGERARDARVPSLLLQPLVENAFRHGVASLTSGAKIEIEAAVQDHTLTLRVADNGAGFGAPSEQLLRSGFGLSNTAARLQQLYGDRQRLELREGRDGGAEVLIRIPYHAA
jgi:two-component system LytT family sensor kinase